MPYYAVKNGRIPGIYMTWDEAEQQVKGFQGAKYKKFNSKTDADNYISPNASSSASSAAPAGSVRSTAPPQKYASLSTAPPHHPSSLSTAPPHTPSLLSTAAAQKPSSLSTFPPQRLSHRPPSQTTTSAAPAPPPPTQSAGDSSAQDAPSDVTSQRQASTHPVTSQRHTSTIPAHDVFNGVSDMSGGRPKTVLSSSRLIALKGTIANMKHCMTQMASFMTMAEEQLESLQRGKKRATPDEDPLPPDVVAPAAAVPPAAKQPREDLPDREGEYALQ